MADQKMVLGGESPEQVAYKLLLDIIRIEDMEWSPGYEKSIDRQWFLDTYGECLQATKGLRHV
ncbi:MAG: hypothetical protein VYB54_15460 [Pseudomonadota bacterium]|nr:hypothetical protein [Pseudomonadota bacterium]